jgi:hypothetical protein
MRLGRKGFNLLAMILEMILQETLERDIGQKRAKEEGLDCLGIRDRK